MISKTEPVYNGTGRDKLKKKIFQNKFFNIFLNIDFNICLGAQSNVSLRRFF